MWLLGLRFHIKLGLINLKPCWFSKKLSWNNLYPDFYKCLVDLFLIHPFLKWADTSLIEAQISLLYFPFVNSQVISSERE